MNRLDKLCLLSNYVPAARAVLNRIENKETVAVRTSVIGSTTIDSVRTEEIPIDSSRYSTVELVDYFSLLPSSGELHLKIAGYLTGPGDAINMENFSRVNKSCRKAVKELRLDPKIICKMYEVTSSTAKNISNFDRRLEHMIPKDMIPVPEGYVMMGNTKHGVLMFHKNTTVQMAMRIWIVLAPCDELARPIRSFGAHNRTLTSRRPLRSSTGMALNFMSPYDDASKKTLAEYEIHQGFSEPVGCYAGGYF